VVQLNGEEMCGIELIKKTTTTVEMRFTRSQLNQLLHDLSGITAETAEIIWFGDGSATVVHKHVDETKRQFNPTS
jgi:hypothetical protein